ncbi:LysM-domain-containing protein [Phellopilus nigrolimitatus]|nr:LysM-domain-containing protein [Phellopilus nigrolimitatus]
MGRWTHYDEDDYRLPEGMKRVGYDADTQKYSFRDQDGVYWEGPEGAEFGELRRVGEESDTGADLEATAPTRADGYQPLTGGGYAWRQLLPFFLIILVFLLLVFRLVSPSVFKAQPKPCAEHSRPYTIKSGDTCWEISKDYGTSLESLQSINPAMDCATLKPGQGICVPMEV